MTESLDEVVLECPNCGWETSYSLEDEWVDVESGDIEGLVRESSLPNIISEFSSEGVDKDITCFWRHLSCEKCGKRSNVVSFLADPSELSGSEEEVRNRVMELRREEQVVEIYPRPGDSE